MTDLGAAADVFRTWSEFWWLKKTCRLIQHLDEHSFRSCKMKILFVALIIALSVAACSLRAHDTGANNLQSAQDPLNASYVVEGETTRLIDGISETAVAPPSATKVRTTVFGNPVMGDLDGDGNGDAALILVQDPGGSGTFVYAVVALKSDGGYRGTNAVLLGDRIVPMDIKIRNGVVMVRFLDRRPGEPMSAMPSVERLEGLYVQRGMLKMSIPCIARYR
jgi:hypothetical protein